MVFAGGCAAGLLVTDPALARFVGETFARLLATPRFTDYLGGHLPGDEASQARLPLLEAKLARLAALAGRDGPGALLAIE